MILWVLPIRKKLPGKLPLFGKFISAENILFAVSGAKGCFIYGLLILKNGFIFQSMTPAYFF